MLLRLVFPLIIIIGGAGGGSYKFHLCLPCQLFLVHNFYSYVKIFKTFTENM